LLAERHAHPALRHLRLARGSSDAGPQPRLATILREAAIAAILAGRIPGTGHFRVWGGHGQEGTHCVICTLRIRSSDYVLAVEFARAEGFFYDDPAYHVHRACFTAYQTIRRAERIP